MAASARYRSWLRRHWAGLATGFSLTLLAVLLHLAGLTAPFEWDAYDFLVRRFSTQPASDRIVHIDIDDDALRRVGSWPWPRQVQAEVVRVLSELGAERIVLDIVWSDPRPPEVDSAGLELLAGVGDATGSLGEISAENVVYPDEELASAIVEAGNAGLAMYYQDVPESDTLPPLEAEVALLLRGDFTLDADALAIATGETREGIDAFLAGLKRRLAEDLVAGVVADRPEATLAEIQAAILGKPPVRPTADSGDLEAAFERLHNLAALRAKCPEVPPSLKGKLPRTSRVVPPLAMLAGGAGHVGFVTFRPDPDGRTRRVPLLIEWEGRLLEHLAFTAAREALGVTIDDLAISERGELLVSRTGGGGSGQVRIPLDEEGRLLINWHVQPGGWQGCFIHRPVTLFLQLFDCRKAMRENDRARQWHIGQAIRLIKDDAGFDLYRQNVNRLVELERRQRFARPRPPGGSPVDAAREVASLRAWVAREQADAVQLIREEWAALQAEPDPADPQIAAEYQRFRQAHELIDGRVPELERANERLAAEHQRLTERLRPMVAGRICFVGYTATAVADMVNTPPYRSVPGVLVHSSVLNSFLQGRFRSWASRPVQAGIIALCGLATTLLTATFGPRLTFGLVLCALIGGFFVPAWLLFGRLDGWLPMMTALVLTFVTWALIVLVWYLTEEREKRRFSRAVAQYVSPAIARRIADTTENLDLSPVAREVSCFFSDLRGFTRLSERLGPEGTRTVLNPYLQVMSQVLHRHQALINKFMGDGVFAFFNPPILPCELHARAACEAALDTQQALAELITRYAGHPLAGGFAELSMRIGVATGPVFVGDYGSENKLDYTCMGDTVNLAARLESANKFFGTRIMVAGPTRELAGGGYECRFLGTLKVVGRSRSVPVYELLGRSSEVKHEVLRFADLFEQGVTAFGRREWSQSVETFRQCLSIRPDDAGVHRYLETIQRFTDTPPPADWDGDLELAVK
jgi:adenylate cyclase